MLYPPAMLTTARRRFSRAASATANPPPMHTPTKRHPVRIDVGPRHQVLDRRRVVVDDPAGLVAGTGLPTALTEPGRLERHAVYPASASR